MAPSGSYRVAAYIRAARRLRMPILVVSNSEYSLVPEIAAGITVDLSEPQAAMQAIVRAVGPRDVACVLATDDSCAELASRVAGHYGLRHNSPAASRLTQRKDLGREALARAGCRTPGFRVVEIASASADGLDLDYPVVVKPLSLSASRGVIRADNKLEFAAACRRVDALLGSIGIDGFARDHLLVETYIDGPEFAVEGFIVDGEFAPIALFDKPEPLNGPYFEETYYLTPSRLPSEQRHRLIDEVARCCRAYGLEQGPVHAELRIAADGPVLLELAARTIGGQCGRLIEFSLQQKLEELVIRGMCGMPFERESQAGSAGVLMIPITESGILQRVEGLTAAMQTEFVEDIEIHINPGYELVPLPEGASYLGFIFAKAPDFELAYAALRRAHGKLKFVTRPSWKLENLA